MKSLKLKKISRVLIVTLLVFSLLPQRQTSASTIFNDYQPNQYWSEDMLWAIENGLISGYLNVPHPTNKAIKTVGNWLDPHAPLTESQMLSVLFRYTSKAELKGSNQYQLAAKYKIPVKGSKNTVVTRGNLAQALATKHFGKQVSMEKAVLFMYDANISEGKVDKNGKAPMTYESFGVNDQLKRAHIVSFMYRYDSFVNPGVVKAKYGKHTYRSRNQSEYDKVMKIVSEAIKAREADSSWKTESDHIPNELYEAFFNGERGNRDRNDPSARVERNIKLVLLENDYGDLLKAGVTKEQMYDLFRMTDVASSLLSRDRVDKSDLTSAYDALVRKTTNSFADANVVTAIFDSKGYTTAILLRPGDLDPIVKMAGKWISVKNQSIVDLKAHFEAGGFVYVQPTDGTILW